MAFFTRVAFPQGRCAPVVVRNDFAPLFSLFDDSLNELHRATRHAKKTFNPRFNVKEAKDSYSVEAEVPGVNEKDLTIEFTDEHTLTIKGRTERHVESSTRPTDEVEAQQKTAVEEGTATPASEAESVKSHQATVEDEEPANTSAVAASSEAVEKAPAKETVKAETPKEKVWISERRVGEFTRSFQFPARVDQEAVKASLKNGLLNVVIPKAPVPESRRIQIE